MKRFVIRADDLGYSEAINYGIAKTVKCGVVGSVGLMPNMPCAEHGVELLREADVCIGQHTNICLGRPCADPDRIPSLLNEQGEFHSSRIYREAWKQGEEFTVLDEMVLEVEAQYHRFLELTGEKPGYFEGHAVQSKNLFKALEIVAKRYNLRYNEMKPSGTEGCFNGKPVFNCAMYSMRPGEYDPERCLMDAVEKAEEDIANVFICHPGYLDAYVLRTSSLTVNRAKEVEMLCAPEIREWLAGQDVQLITYDDI